ncbi:MAG: hypothetical protein KAH04_07895, partial [Psychrilyobacter sp.]|nr:hypothetical protein [Psychrilyobacter sp.]
VVKRKIIAHSPMSPVIGKKIYICNRFKNQILIINKEDFSIESKIDTVREPISLIISKDEKKLFVAGHLPEGSALDNDISANIALISLETNKEVSRILLPAGSMGVRDITISPNGKWAIVSHILARFQVPTTQIDRGWINTNAISVIDCENDKRFGTVLLDSVDYGAANPWDCAFSKDGKNIYIALGGTHEVFSIEFDKMINLVKNSDDSDYISNRLSYLSSISKRIPVKGKGPRCVKFFNDSVYVLDYFSDSIEKISIQNNFVSAIFLKNGNSFALIDDNYFEGNQIRFGEYLFNNGDICFQKWQSCASCHPDGRADGLNWDLLNDGIGNPKQTKSMLNAHETPPAMITGIRAEAKIAVRAGLKYILFLKRPEKEALAIDAFLSDMKPIPSPYLQSGKLSPNAVKGKLLMEKASCLYCHNGPYFTNGKRYSFDLGSDRDKNRLFDTPALLELWRTSPYMYDGRHQNLKSLLIESKESGRHGEVTKFSEEEIDLLVEYLLSI